MHRPEVLIGELNDLGIKFPNEFAKRRKLFEWTTGLRYETGRLDTGETIAFLNRAKAILQWVESQQS